MCELANNLYRSPADPNEATPTYGVVTGTALVPEDHAEIEAWILRRAAAAYKAGEQLLFRTLLLSGDEIRSPPIRSRIGLSSGDERSTSVFKNVLFATVPGIRNSLHLRAKAWLRLHARKNPDNP